MPPDRVRPAPWSVWLMAARPRTLTAAIAPVLVGTAAAIADGGFAPLPALAALCGAVWIQIGTNFANDYFDARKGADSERVGPTRVTQAGLVAPRAMRRAIGLAFGAAFACGIYLVAVAGWPVVAIGLASILCGVAYTGGPYPLGYHGLGDLFVFVFFGPVAVAGTYFVQTLRWSPAVAWISVPVGSLCVAILVVNNLRDLGSDRKAGKRTLVVRHGRRFGRAQYGLLVAAAYAAPAVLAAAGKISFAFFGPTRSARIPTPNPPSKLPTFGPVWPKRALSAAIVRSQTRCRTCPPPIA